MTDVQWTSRIGSVRELIDRPIIANTRYIFYQGAKGQLWTPPGHKKLSSIFINSIVVKSQIESLAGMEIPYMDGTETPIIRDRMLRDYFWGSQQYRLEIWQSFNNGGSWTRAGQFPVPKVLGVPENQIDLMQQIDGGLLRAFPGMWLAALWRDVGWGVPKQNVDSVRVELSGGVKERIYPFELPTPPTYITTNTIQLTPLAPGTYRLILPARPGRKTLQFQTITTASTVTCTIKYASPQVSGDTLVLTGNTTSPGLPYYTGELSFTMSAQLNNSLTVTEQFSNPV